MVAQSPPAEGSMIMKKITALSLALALSACQYLMATLRSERKMLKRDEEGERPGVRRALEMASPKRLG
jgi:hypothetical protein